MAYNMVQRFYMDRQLPTVIYLAWSGASTQYNQGARLSYLRELNVSSPASQHVCVGVDVSCMNDHEMEIVNQETSSIGTIIALCGPRLVCAARYDHF